MKYSKSSTYDKFYCDGDRCAAPCPAPVDMTWTRTLGDFCEIGLSMGCPRAASMMLLHQQQAQFLWDQDQVAGLPGPSQELLTQMLDGRRTVELLLTDRTMDLRARLVLALSYGAGLEPLLKNPNAFAFQELDWGYTEQPVRQFQSLAQHRGAWELRRSDICNLLWRIQRQCSRDSVLSGQLEDTMALFRSLSGEQYRLLRDHMDQVLTPRDYIFENLLMYYVHRYFLGDAWDATIAPAMKQMAVCFVTIRSVCAQIWQTSGSLPNDTLVSLCWHYARCMEEDPAARAALKQALSAEPIYDWDRLLRLLWK